VVPSGVGDGTVEDNVDPFFKGHFVQRSWHGIQRPYITQPTQTR
jgi:hypothetical protein